MKGKTLTIKRSLSKLPEEKKNQVTNKGTVVRTAWEFSKATLETRKQYWNAFDTPNENDLPPRNLYLARLQINFGSKGKTFQELQVSKPLLPMLFRNYLNIRFMETKVTKTKKLCAPGNKRCNTGEMQRASRMTAVTVRGQQLYGKSGGITGSSWNWERENPGKKKKKRKKEFMFTKEDRWRGRNELGV